MTPLSCTWYPSARRAALMVVGIHVFFAVCAAPPLEARSQKTQCKKIQAAIRAGHTLDQIMAEFDVDAQQVMKCTQKKVKHRKQKTTKPTTAGQQPSSGKTKRAASAH